VVGVAGYEDTGGLVLCAGGTYAKVDEGFDGA
jgi:hypothetical protein